ncbi:MAG: hypothetical protein O2794_02235 [bacterium]|nr:hypothetical protein [bacterium]
MIYLLFGEDRQASSRNLQKFIDRFESEVPFAWHQIRCDNENGFDTLLESIGGDTLFGKKSYLIIKNLSKADSGAEEILKDFIKGWEGDDSIIVFYEEGIPKKGKLFDAIKKRAKQVQEFNYISIVKLRDYIESEAVRTKTKISAEVKEHLTRLYQDSPEKFTGEFEKILLGGEANRIVTNMQDKELFLLGDYWGRGEREKAFFHFEKLMMAGFKPDGVLRTLLWHVRNICSAEVGNIKGMSSFVLSKASNQARNFSHEELERAQEALVMWSDPRKKEDLETGLLYFLLAH